MTKKFTYLGIVLLMLIILPGQIVAQTDFAGQKVLFIDSYHAGYPWSDGIEAGILAVFEGTGIEFQVVHMDTKRNKDELFREAAALEALAVIEAVDPDLIIATEDNAQKYLVVPYLMETDYPIIFAGVNWDAAVYGYPAANITGMVEVELVEQLIDHLGKYAQGNRIGYLAVASETESKAIDIYQERFFDGALQVHTVSTFDEYQEAFMALQDEVDMVFLGNNAGIDRWDEVEAAHLFVENTRVPTGSVREWTAPYALMTLAKIAEEQGEWVAQTALQILDGTPIADIPMAENRHGKLILNLDIAEQLDLVFAPALLRTAEIYAS